MKTYFSKNIFLYKELLKKKPKEWYDYLRMRSSRVPVLRPQGDTLGERKQEIMSDLNQKGYYVWNNYCDPASCAAIIEEFEEIMRRFPGKIWNDDTKSDNRLYGANFFSERIDSFLNDKRFVELGCKYLNVRQLEGITLANKVIPKEGNLGSGGGWHRDSLGSQFKAFLYLENVDESAGPFQFVEGSHRTGTKMSQFLKNKFGHEIRYLSTEIEEFSSAIKTFCCTAGTAFLVDTTGIHRGKPITEGVRYALTNYYGGPKLDPGVAAAVNFPDDL